MKPVRFQPSIVIAVFSLLAWAGSPPVPDGTLPTQLRLSWSGPPQDDNDGGVADRFTHGKIRRRVWDGGKTGPEGGGTASLLSLRDRDHP